MKLGLLLLIFLCFFSQAKGQPVSKPTRPDNEEQHETLKIDTNLVTVPVIASSPTGKYIADLTKEEFKLAEDGVPQQIAFLAAVNAPFHVVLLLDTSGSTNEKLPMIQRAAIAFIEQLSGDDKVKVISFDDSVHDWNDFSSDKVLLRGVISKATSGQGTKVYDAVEAALNSLRPINGRKAIVMFSDAVDWHSDSATFDGTVKNLDQSGVIVYPIRFDTRAETERVARQQDAQQNGAGLPTSDTIRTTPPTFPSEDPSSVPSTQRRGSSLPDIIFSRPDVRRRREPQGSPTSPFPDTGPKPRMPPPDSGSTSGTIKKDDSITAMLNQLYLMADSYLQKLAERSGGQVYRADSLTMLPQAFASIAAELHTQYLLGYYPTNENKDGTYRKIQVKTTRKDISIRARPGYRAGD
jgi:VWFA-related protein